LTTREDGCILGSESEEAMLNLKENWDKKLWSRVNKDDNDNDPVVHAVRTLLLAPDRLTEVVEFLADANARNAHNKRVMETPEYAAIVDDVFSRL